MNKFFEVFDKRDMLDVRTSRNLVFAKILPALTFSAVAGVISGLVVTLFVALLDLVGKFARNSAVVVGNNLKLLPLFILVAFALAIVMRLLIRVLPEAKGSGIPRSENMLNGKGEGRWLHMALATFVGSIVSFIGGLTVGSEGPSVQLGAGIGRGVERLVGNAGARRYISNGSTAAGIAAAFGAPITGILFVIEEIQRKFNPLIVASACIAVLYGTAVQQLLSVPLNISENFFAVEAVATIPLNYLWIAVVCGVVCTLTAFAFNTAIIKINAISQRSRLPQTVMLVAVFVITAVVDVFYIEATGSGKGVVDRLVGAGYDLQNIAILLAVKLVLICMCFRSGTTGGMMIPMLSLGALIGGLMGYGFIQAGMPQECFGTVVLICMCTFFGSNICAPLTVVALFAETTGVFSALLPLVISVFISQLLGKVIKQKPLYDTLAEMECPKYLTEF